MARTNLPPTPRAKSNEYRGGGYPWSWLRLFWRVYEQRVNGILDRQRQKDRRYSMYMKGRVVRGKVIRGETGENDEQAEKRSTGDERALHVISHTRVRDTTASLVSPALGYLFDQYRSEKSPARARQTFMQQCSKPEELPKDMRSIAYQRKRIQGAGGPRWTLLPKAHCKVFGFWC